MKRNYRLSSDLHASDDCGYKWAQEKTPKTPGMTSHTFSSHPLDELGERLPLCRVHVHVLLVADVLLIDDVGVHALRAEATPQQLREVRLELSASAQQYVHVYVTYT